MPVFRLTPIPECLEHPDWIRSTHTRECHVSVADCNEARRFAKGEFDIAAGKPAPGALVPNSPWLNSDLVTVMKSRRSQETLVPVDWSPFPTSEAL